jgi:hypothetical protein
MKAFSHTYVQSCAPHGKAEKQSQKTDSRQIASAMVRADHGCRIMGLCHFETNDRRYAWLSDIEDVEMQLRRPEEDTGACVIANCMVATERL